MKEDIRLAAFYEIPPMLVYDVERRTLITKRKKFRRAVRLDGDLVYYSNIFGGIITVGEGFPSDGASVPQILWNLFPPFGEYLESAVVHDMLCKAGKTGIPLCDSKTAHKIFGEAMKAQGIPSLKRKTMTWAVRMFGPKFDGPAVIDNAR